MKLSNSLRFFWRVPVAIAITSVLAEGASLASGQTRRTPSQAQGAPLTLLLSGPAGDPSTLVYSAKTGWRMHAGWDAVAQRADADARPTKTALKPPTIPTDEQPPMERPLTVFIDGPTGFTFIYAFDEGWKFVGQVANASR